MFRKYGLSLPLNIYNRFTGKDDLSTTNLLKSSAQRAIRKQIMDQYPYFTEELIELVFPKKSNIYQTKCRENGVVLLVVDNEPLFFQHFDGPFIPTLRLVHKCKSEYDDN